jgi:hypothetical protein
MKDENSKNKKNNTNRYFPDKIEAKWPHTELTFSRGLRPRFEGAFIRDKQAL